MEEIVFIAENGGNLQYFLSREVAERYLEPADVNSDLIRAYRTDGTPLKLDVVKDEEPLFMGMSRTRYRVVIREWPDVDREKGRTDFRQALIHTLIELDPDSESLNMLPLGDLVNLLMKETQPLD